MICLFSGLSAPHCPGVVVEVTTIAPTVTAIPIDVRVPNNTIPYHYSVELKPNIYGDDPEKFTFDGNVEVYLECVTPTNIVTVHINHLTVDNSSIEFVSLSGGSAPLWTSYDIDLVRQFFKLNLDGDLSPGNKYIMKMSFTGPLTDDLMGLYRSSYKEGNITK